MAASFWRRMPAALLALPLLGAGEPLSQVELTFDNLRNERGVLRVCVTADPRHFPDCQQDAGAISRSVPASTRSLSLRLAPGTYAVSLVHDENGNGKLDTLLGIPREGFAFSRNPAIRFGPPRFDEASFRVGDEVTLQTLRVRYLL